MRNTDTASFWHCFLIIAINKSFYPWTDLRMAQRQRPNSLGTKPAKNGLSHPPPLPLPAVRNRSALSSRSWKQKAALEFHLGTQYWHTVLPSILTHESTLGLTYWPLSQKQDLSSSSAFLSASFVLFSLQWAEGCPLLPKDMSIFCDCCLIWKQGLCISN